MIVGFAGRGFSNFSGVGGLVCSVVRLTEFRFFGPRARPLVRCVNCFPSSISCSTVVLGSGADLLFTGTGLAAMVAIPPGGPFDNIVANAGLNRFTIESLSTNYLTGGVPLTALVVSFGGVGRDFCFTGSWDLTADSTDGFSGVSDFGNFFRGVGLSSSFLGVSTLVMALTVGSISFF